MFYMEHSEYGRDVAERVAQAIEASGLSLREVATRTGIALPTLHRKKSGLHAGSRFDVDEVYAIARALGVKTTSLYPDEVA